MGGHQVNGAVEAAGAGADLRQAGFGGNMQVDEGQKIIQCRRRVGHAVAQFLAQCAQALERGQVGVGVLGEVVGREVVGGERIKRRAFTRTPLFAPGVWGRSGCNRCTETYEDFTNSEIN